MPQATPESSWWTLRASAKPRRRHSWGPAKLPTTSAFSASACRATNNRCASKDFLTVLSPFFLLLLSLLSSSVTVLQQRLARQQRTHFYALFLKPKLSPTFPPALNANLPTRFHSPEKPGCFGISNAPPVSEEARPISVPADCHGPKKFRPVLNVIKQFGKETAKGGR